MQWVRMNNPAWFRITAILGLASLSVALLVLLARFVGFGINVTDSLPGSVFIIIKNSSIDKGKLIAFYPPASSLHLSSDVLVKRIVGLPGDEVWQQDSVYFVNDKQVGFAFETTRTGLKLEPGPKGTLPEAHYFVATEHPYSFDSRYAEIGWVHDKKIIGRVMTLW